MSVPMGSTGFVIAQTPVFDGRSLAVGAVDTTQSFSALAENPPNIVRPQSMKLIVSRRAYDGLAWRMYCRVVVSYARRKSLSA